MCHTTELSDEADDPAGDQENIGEVGKALFEPDVVVRYGGDGISYGCRAAKPCSKELLEHVGGCRVVPVTRHSVISNSTSSVQR